MSGVVFGLILFGFSTYLGVKIGKKYTEALRFWQDFHQLNTLCCIKIPAYKTAPADCVQEVRKGTFSSLARQMLSLDKEISFPNFLSKEEREYVSSYFYKLKTLDLQSLSILFQETQAYTHQKEEYAKTACEKNEKTCKKLGVLAGLAAFIFVV